MQKHLQWATMKATDGCALRPLANDIQPIGNALKIKR